MANNVGSRALRTSMRMTLALSTQDLSNLLNEERPLDATGHVGMKVVFTLGPACHTVAEIQELLNAGGNCARLLLGWGTSKFQATCLSNLRIACSRTGKVCGLMVETKGREVTVKAEPEIDDSGVPRYTRKLEARTKDKIVLTTRSVTGKEAERVVCLSQTNFPAQCIPGDILVLGQFLSVGDKASTLRLSVVDISETDVVCMAMNSVVLEGMLTVSLTETTSNDGIANPDLVLTASDMSSLKALAGTEIDFVSLSHVESVADVLFSRKILSSIGINNVKIFAKLESGKSLVRSPDILKQADGIILSRGKLSTSVSPSKLSLMQKTIVSRINLQGKPVLATRVAGSLVRSNQLSRSDENEVISAVMDGFDGIVLGAETHTGEQPAAAVTEILKVCKQAESCVNNNMHLANLEQLLGNDVETGSVDHLTLNTIYLSSEQDVAACLAFCQSGVPLEAVRRCHLKVPILVPLFTSKLLKGQLDTKSAAAKTARLCSVYGGVIPLPILERQRDAEQPPVRRALKACIAQNYLDEDSLAIIMQQTDGSFTSEITDLQDIAREISDADSEAQSIQSRDPSDTILNTRMTELLDRELPSDTSMSQSSVAQSRNGFGHYPRNRNLHHQSSANGIMEYESPPEEGIAEVPAGGQTAGRPARSPTPQPKGAAAVAKEVFAPDLYDSSSENAGPRRATAIYSTAPQSIFGVPTPSPGTPRHPSRPEDPTSDSQSNEPQGTYKRVPPQQNPAAGRPAQRSQTPNGIQDKEIKKGQRRPSPFNPMREQPFPDSSNNGSDDRGRSPGPARRRPEYQPPPDQVSHASEYGTPRGLSPAPSASVASEQMGGHAVRQSAAYKPQNTASIFADGRVNQSTGPDRASWRNKANDGRGRSPLPGMRSPRRDPRGQIQAYDGRPGKSTADYDLAFAASPAGAMPRDSYYNQPDPADQYNREPQWQQIQQTRARTPDPREMRQAMFKAWSPETRNRPADIDHSMPSRIMRASSSQEQLGEQGYQRGRRNYNPAYGNRTAHPRSHAATTPGHSRPLSPSPSYFWNEGTLDSHNSSASDLHGFHSRQELPSADSYSYQVRTLEDARSIVAGGRSIHAAMPVQPRASRERDSALHVGRQTLPAYTTERAHSNFLDDHVQTPGPRQQEHNWQQYARRRPDKSGGTPRAASASYAVNPAHHNPQDYMDTTMDRTRVPRHGRPHGFMDSAMDVPGNPRHAGQYLSPKTSYESPIIYTPEPRVPARRSPSPLPGNRRRDRESSSSASTVPEIPAHRHQGHQRSMTPGRMSQYESPGLPRPASEAIRPHPDTFMQDRYQGLNIRSGRTVNLPASFMEKPTLRSNTIPRVVGGKLVPSFSVNSVSSDVGDPPQYGNYYPPPPQGEGDELLYENPSSVYQPSLDDSRPRTPRPHRPVPTGQRMAATANRSESTQPDRPPTIAMQRSASFHTADSAGTMPGQSKYNAGLLASAPDNTKWKSGRAQASRTPEPSRNRTRRDAENDQDFQPDHTHQAPQQATARAVHLEHVQKGSQDSAPEASEATAVTKGGGTENESQNNGSALVGPSNVSRAAEDKMRDYLIVEGIKIAHHNALYATPARAQKKRNILDKWLGKKN